MFSSCLIFVFLPITVLILPWGILSIFFMQLGCKIVSLLYKLLQRWTIIYLIESSLFLFLYFDIKKECVFHQRRAWYIFHNSIGCGVTFSLSGLKTTYYKRWSFFWIGMDLFLMYRRNKIFILLRFASVTQTLSAKHEESEINNKRKQKFFIYIVLRQYIATCHSDWMW